MYRQRGSCQATSEPAAADGAPVSRDIPTFLRVRARFVVDFFSAGSLPARGGAMFQESLKAVVDRSEGAIAGVLMGFDGITVDSYSADGAGGNIETIGMEYSVVLKQIMEAAEMLELGATHEVAVQADNLIAVIRLLNEEYFVAVTMQPSGNMGKARYLLRLQAPELLAALT
jgi:predicted regulator of Ras-like GTPase activity (Roadblock/LC7/MglB family)